jgi:hypothetical protein
LAQRHSIRNNPRFEKEEMRAGKFVLCVARTMETDTWPVCNIVIDADVTEFSAISNCNQPQ